MRMYMSLGKVTLTGELRDTCQRKFFMKNMPFREKIEESMAIGVFVRKILRITFFSRYSEGINKLIETDG